MHIQFNSDSSVMGTEDVANRIEAQVRERLARFEDRLTRLEVHVRDENAAKGGGDDKVCVIEARPRSGSPLSATANAADVDTAARSAATKLGKLLDTQFGKAERHSRDPSPDKII